MLQFTHELQVALILFSDSWFLPNNPEPWRHAVSAAECVKVGNHDCPDKVFRIDFQQIVGIAVACSPAFLTDDTTSIFIMCGSYDVMRIHAQYRIQRRS